MTLALITVLLAVLAIRMLRLPEVRAGLGTTAVLAAALVILTGHGAVLVALAASVAAAVLGPVLLLHRLTVPIPARARRAS